MRASSTAEVKSTTGQLFKRHHAEPVLSPADWPYEVNTVFNPGVATLADGSTLLLARVETRTGLSHLTAARSRDGMTDWKVDSEPTLLPAPEHWPQEQWGVEDARITFIPERNEYFICYTAYSRSGAALATATTRDFKNFKRLAVALPPDNKDAAVLPRRVNGRWVMFHRPLSEMSGDIWMCHSPDLEYWGDHRRVLQTRGRGFWDSKKVGLGPPLIDTDEGWIMIYHGARESARGAIYRVGMALLDRDQPHKVLRRSDHWVFGPETANDRSGDINNVVFPTGFTIDPEDDDVVRIYYGIADTSIGLVTARISDMLEHLQRDDVMTST